ncbi:MAG: nucleoside recognition domain-containing protein [Rikenellaceae bacterium]
MVLNYIWAAFFIVAFIVATLSAIFTGEGDLFSAMVNETFNYAKLGFEISLGLTGVLCLWLGIMRVGEKAGVVNMLARRAAPLFSKLFPEIPKEHPVTGSMFMNFSANLLGLDNAATPIGLNVMQQLQGINKDKTTASNSMIMFLMINASGLTLLPVTIMMYRAQLGADNPADVFVPIMIATGVSTLTAITLTAIKQKINLLQRAILVPGLCFVAFIIGVTWLFTSGDKEVLSAGATIFSNVLLMGVITSFIVIGLFKKVNVYDNFIEGAKDGFKTAITIIPYLVAILVAIGVFRASGAMDFIIAGISNAIESMGLNSDFTGALPTIFMKPLSGSGARGMMIDAMNSYGVDSFVGRLSSIVQGSTDTTFYAVALYFGSVAIKRIRYTLTYSLIADLMGVLTAIAVAYIFWA